MRNIKSRFGEFYAFFTDERNWIESAPDLCIENIRNNLNALNDSKIFNIVDEEAVKLLCNTNNKIYLRRMPFDTIFINTDIPYDDVIIRGILINSGVLKKTQEHIISILCFAKKDGISFKDNYVSTHIKVNGLASNIHYNQVDYDKSSLDFIGIFVCNFLDFLNNPDVKMMSVEREAKRGDELMIYGKRKKFTKCSIFITGKLKIYINKIKSDGIYHIDYKFWVRGHFRTLRNIYRYGCNAGKKIWIPPYIKGMGMLIEKEYEVKKGDINNMCS